MNCIPLPRTASILVVVGLFTAGCGSSNPTTVKLYPVRGTLHTADGKAAAGATVTFHSTGGAKLAPAPFGIVGGDGTFRITSVSTADGAPAGTYAVTVVWRPVFPADVPEDKLKGKYADPTKPLTTVTVREGETVLEPLKLK